MQLCNPLIIPLFHRSTVPLFHRSPVPLFHRMPAGRQVSLVPDYYFGIGHKRSMTFFQHYQRIDIQFADLRKINGKLT
jgi:hypothetical protein